MLDTIIRQELLAPKTVIEGPEAIAAEELDEAEELMELMDDEE